MSKYIWPLIDGVLMRSVWAFKEIWPLLRSKFHNKLAWLVVISGVGIVSGPFWEPYLRALCEKYLHISVEPSPHPIWGCILVFFGLVYHLISNRLEHLASAVDRQAAVMERQRAISHDKPVIQKFQSVFPENSAISLFSSLENGHSFRSGMIDSLHSAIDFLEKDENCLLDPEMQGLAKKLNDELTRLALFIAGNFFFYSTHKSQGDLYVLQPNLNMDRAPDTPSAQQQCEYKKYENELLEMTMACRDACSSFIKTAHARVL